MSHSIWAYLAILGLEFLIGRNKKIGANSILELVLIAGLGLVLILKKNSKDEPSNNIPKGEL